MPKRLQTMLLALAVLGAACHVPEPPPPAPSYPSYPLGLEAAIDSGKPMLLYFSATWCSICRHMEAGGLADPEVRRVMQDYILVQVDVDRQAHLAEKYLVGAVPALVVVSPDEHVLGRSQGLKDAAELLVFLNG